MPDTTTPSSGPDRRTVLTGAAWAVPAIVAVSTSPAYAAASDSYTITLSTPNQQILATGGTTATVTVTDGNGAPASGTPVSFTGPSGATVTPATATTNSSGVATTSVNLGTPWRTPGSTITVTATTGSQSMSQPLTVLGGNALATGIWSGVASSPTTTSTTLTQVELAFPSPLVQIASSWLVLLKNGTVWVRGSNSSGQFGDGTAGTSRTTWGMVPNLTDVTQIATGNGLSHYAVRSDGTLWSWGYNNYGALGLGDTANRTVPTRVTSLSGVSQISVRTNSVHALTNGAVWGWGANDGGQVGNGSTAASGVRSPVQIIAGGAASLSHRNNATAALMNDGRVLVWGLLGSTVSASPSEFAPLRGATQLGSAPATTYAILSDGSAQSWGSNSKGQGGTGDTTTSNTSARAIAGLATGATTVRGGGSGGGVDIGSGYALMTDGTLRAWGVNGSGQLGDGSTTDRSTPVTPALPADAPPISALSDIVGATMAVILKAD